MPDTTGADPTPGLGPAITAVTLAVSVDVNEPTSLSVQSAFFTPAPIEQFN